jgi:hypothetical protein
MSRLWFRMATVFTVVGLVAIFLSGCRDQEAPPSTVSSQNIRLLSTEKLSASANRVEGVAMPEFGAEISLNRHKLNIPADALKDRTVISIMEPDPRYVVADYGPEGLKFEKPVEISVHYGGLDLGDTEEQDLTIYYFDPEKETWVGMQGRVDTVEELVMIRTDHFSRYALSDHHHFQQIVR